MPQVRKFLSTKKRSLPKTTKRSVRSVDVAFGSQRPKKTPNPSFKQKGSSFTVSHEEELTLVDGTADWNLSHIRIQPGDDECFPWLSTIAPSFQTYRFSKLEFVYIPSCSDFTDGSVSLAIEPNSHDTLPTNSQVMSSYEGCVQGQALKRLTLTVGSRILNSLRGDRYTCVGNIPTGADPLLYDVGTLLISTFGGSAVGWGKLWVRYTVHLMIPQVTSNVEGLQVVSKLAGTIPKIFNLGNSTNTYLDALASFGSALLTNKNTPGVLIMKGILQLASRWVSASLDDGTGKVLDPIVLTPVTFVHPWTGYVLISGTFSKFVGGIHAPEGETTPLPKYAMAPCTGFTADTSTFVGQYPSLSGSTMWTLIPAGICTAHVSKVLETAGPLYGELDGEPHGPASLLYEIESNGYCQYLQGSSENGILVQNYTCLLRVVADTDDLLVLQPVIATSGMTAQLNEIVFCSPDPTNFSFDPPGSSTLEATANAGDSGWPGSYYNNPLDNNPNIWFFPDPTGQSPTNDSPPDAVGMIKIAPGSCATPRPLPSRKREVDVEDLPAVSLQPQPAPSEASAVRPKRPIGPCAKHCC